MKPLQENYKIFVLLGICPPDKPISRRMKIFHIFNSVFFGINLFVFLISTTVFYVKHFSTDLAISINVICEIIALAIGFYSLITAHIKRNDIKKIFDDFQAFEAANEHKDPAKYMKKANQQGDQIVRFFYKYVLIIGPTSILVSSVGSLFYSQWKYGYINPDSLFRICHLSLPWNSNTILGWMIETFFICFMSMSFWFVVPAILTLFVSVCNYHWAFYKMFRLQVANIDAKAGFKPFPTDRIKNLMHESISFHMAAKELFPHTAKTFSPFVLMHLIGSILVMAGCIFRMDLAIHNFNIEALFMLFGTLTTASILYLWCYNGKCSTDYYAEYANCLYKSNWRIMPVQLQKYYILMIAHAQKPLYYHGCGLFEVNLGTFIRVIKTVLSYYMIFKTLTDIV